MHLIISLIYNEIPKFVLKNEACPCPPPCPEGGQ